MKRLMYTVYLLLFVVIANAQQKFPTEGAYLAKADGINHLWLFVDGYSSYITYEDQKYLNTWGGPYAGNDKDLIIKIEYNEKEPATVGTEQRINAKVAKDGFSWKNLNFKKLKAGEQDLDGLWRITGRMNEGKMSTITRGDRKTIKILVAGYFQWIAINPAEKGFYGTGGGTYTFKDKKYTENIVFFSRDNSRVGAKLVFDGEIKDGAWHHSGLSSKGDPIHEIWSVDSVKK
ncbi:hypothetical protein ACFRAE_02425 [Sphingobacterium sp. HJSM2_6]|uniref:hypothetical protein n=1 Tax=Sphingobacterium sp. HJSM2_6 TaxID=3366264 RepID=UPI003BC8FEC0